MRNAFRRLRRNERGMTLLFVGVGFTAFMAATTLAIDVGMVMTARSQAQNAADAGAHAGAVALVFNDFKNRTPTGPVVSISILVMALMRWAPLGKSLISAKTRSGGAAMCVSQVNMAAILEV